MEKAGQYELSHNYLELWKLEKNYEFDYIFKIIIYDELSIEHFFKLPFCFADYTFLP
jgi:hypothetical protein